MFLARGPGKRRHCGLKIRGNVWIIFSPLLLAFLLLFCLKGSPSDMKLHAEQEVKILRETLSSQKTRKGSL